MRKVGFNYRHKKIVLRAKECSSIFRRDYFNSCFLDLVFIFDKPTKTSIHSLFCPEFIAVWLDDKNRVVEVKRIKSWKWNIKPKEKFVNLVEIPINEGYGKIIKFLVEDAKGF